MRLLTIGRPGTHTPPRGSSREGSDGHTGAMLALVLVMLLCVALGAGVVGYVMVEARREGRGEFWTPEGEELIAGARRTTAKVRARGERIGRSAGGVTKDLAARLPERRTARAATGGRPSVGVEEQDGDAGGSGAPYRAAR